MSGVHEWFRAEMDGRNEAVITLRMIDKSPFYAASVLEAATKEGYAYEAQVIANCTIYLFKRSHAPITTAEVDKKMRDRPLSVPNRKDLSPNVIKSINEHLTAAATNKEYRNKPFRAFYNCSDNYDMRPFEDAGWVVTQAFTTRDGKRGICGYWFTRK